MDDATGGRSPVDRFIDAIEVTAAGNPAADLFVTRAGDRARSPLLSFLVKA
jgi:hypothetical protein